MNASPPTTTAFVEDATRSIEDEAVRPVETVCTAPPPLGHRRWPVLVCLALYAILATAIYGGGSWVSSSRIPLCACSDQAQEVWFLAWPPFALTHGHNLFYTWWMNYPFGVNLATNTAMPLLGVLGAPLTWLLGPVATYNFLLRLAFLSSGGSMCLVLRRWTTWWPAAFFGGLLYGFSSYMVGQGEGHLFLTMAPIPPLIFLMADEIIGRRRWTARRAGTVLGLLCVVQYLISPEILVITLLSVLALVVMVAVARRAQVAAVARHVLVAVGWAAGVVAVVLAYPAWMTVAGPQHLLGPPHTLAGLSGFVGDLLGPITPTHTQFAAPTALATIGSSFVGGSTVENGAYLGIPVVLMVVGFTAAFWKRRLLVLSTGLLVVNLVLSFGSRLTVDRHVTAVPLPFALLSRLPFVQAIEPVRFTFGVALFSGAVVALGLDRARSTLTEPRAGPPSAGARAIRRLVARRRLVPAAVVVIAGMAALPLLPRFAYPSVPTKVPSLFTTSAVDRIPRDSVVLTYPYPSHPQLLGLLDQASAAMQFKIAGSSAFIPGPMGQSFSGSEVLAPPQLQTLFYAGYSGLTARLSHDLPLSTTVPEIRTYLRVYGVSTIVFYDAGADPTVVRQYLTAAIGPPTQRFGVTEWFGVRARLHHPAPAVAG